MTSSLLVGIHFLKKNFVFTDFERGREIDRNINERGRDEDMQRRQSDDMNVDTVE